MEVYTAHCPLLLVEANVVKSFEARARDCTHPMIGYKEVFLPPHKYVLPLSVVLKAEIRLSGLSGKWSPSREAIPVLHVNLLVRTPFLVSSLEGILGTDDFSFEISGQGWMICSQACVWCIRTTCIAPRTWGPALPSIRR